MVEYRANENVTPQLSLGRECYTGHCPVIVASHRRDSFQYCAQNLNRSRFFVVRDFIRFSSDLNIKIRIITARKRSLGQGNVFTSVCHSVHGGGSACLHPVGDLHPGGSASGEWGLHRGGGGGWTDRPLDTTRYDQRAGGTHPTECILVVSTRTHQIHFELYCKRSE